MNQIMLWFHTHPYLASTLSTWLCNNILTALVASLPAPTKDSSQKYLFLFRFSNTVMGNLTRASFTHVENSPNWPDAVEKKLNGNGTNGSSLPTASVVNKP